MIKDSLDIVNELMNISIAVSSEKNFIVILEMILSEARRITNADAGTIYLIKDDELKFVVSQNITLKINTINEKNSIDWPSVKMTEENASGYVGLTGEILNIDDVYENNEFDFSGPQKYDKISGYRTKSMLVLPLKDHKNEVIGVIQLINSKDDIGKIVPFDKDVQKILLSLASQAAISVTKTKLMEEIENVFTGFVRVMVTSLDAQTSYNANHTKNMVRMANFFIDYINEQYRIGETDYRFDETKVKRLITSIWLHDIGKIGIPVELLNKPTRLGFKRDVEIILNRIELIKERLNVIHLESKLLSFTNKENNYIENEAWLTNQYEILKNAKNLILSANEQSITIDDNMKRELTKVYEYRFKGLKDVILTPEEFQKLSIYKGTLLLEERKKIEDHILVTNKMLAEINFKDYLEEIPGIVSKHHELLDGSGYPFGLKGDEIPFETRIITILDIFESLTSIERPYRKAFSIQKALEILKAMANEGKLDNKLVSMFIASHTANKFYDTYILNSKHNYDEINYEEIDI
ncbi:MAG: HD domain-containing phosphohydrolase [Sedimentibacter sp.]